MEKDHKDLGAKARETHISIFFF